MGGSAHVSGDAGIVQKIHNRMAAYVTVTPTTRETTPRPTLVSALRGQCAMRWRRRVNRKNGTVTPHKYRVSIAIDVSAKRAAHAARDGRSSAVVQIAAIATATDM